MIYVYLDLGNGKCIPHFAQIIFCMPKFSPQMISPWDLGQFDIFRIPQSSMWWSQVQELPVFTCVDNVFAWWISWWGWLGVFFENDFTHIYIYINVYIYIHMHIYIYIYIHIYQMITCKPNTTPIKSWNVPRVNSVSRAAPTRYQPGPSLLGSGSNYQAEVCWVPGWKKYTQSDWFKISGFVSCPQKYTFIGC